VKLHPSRAVEIIRLLPAFAGLPEQAGLDLIETGELIEYDENRLLIKQGEPSDHALILVEGSVEVFVETKYGFVHLASLEAPALVGEIGLFTNVPRTASIKALSKGFAVKLEANELHLFGQQNPTFLSTLMSQLGRRFETFNRALGFYSHALGALERDQFDLSLLDDLTHPLPELADFSQSFVRLAEQITLRRAYREEMANARAIQESMLPAHDGLDPCKAYVEIEAAMRPAREVGGDLYDFFLIGPDRVAVTVGDVCGKGIPAALFMAMTQMVMRYMLRQEGDVGAAATAGNALLAANNREMMFATLFCAVLDLKTGVLSYCSCGHHSPFIMRKGGTIEKMSEFNLALGLDENTEYRTHSLVLEPLDRLFLFTDGFADAVNRDGSRYGDDRLEEFVAGVRDARSSDLIRGVMSSVDEFATDAPQFDDLTCVLFTFIEKKV
jgi:serine phosphatase RsbU (regulator of sigma subunit)